MSKLIYILSTGHSGSTLSDMWLGTIPGVFSTGEIVNLPWQIFRGEDTADIQTYCSCSKSFKSCSFWRKVYQKLQEKSGVNILKNPRKFDISIHSSFLYNRSKIVSLRHIILLFLFKICGQTFIWKSITKYYQKNIKRNWMLFDTISEESGCDYIVDSSKNFLRYIFLKSYRPQDVKLIVLIRNVHGVASSSHHGLNNKIVRERSKKWHQLYSRVGRLLKDGLKENEYYVLNYEEMCSNPILERQKIAKFIGVNNDLSSSIRINTKDYHLVAGNPIRHQGEISIRYDERWKTRLTKKQIEFLNAMQEKVNNYFKKESQS